MRDPVCGMDVDGEEARAQKLCGDYAGQGYFFCAAVCRQAFLMDPKRFVNRQEQSDLVGGGLSGTLRSFDPSDVKERLGHSGLLPWLEAAVRQNASDLFLSVGQPPTLKVFGSFRLLGDVSLREGHLARIVEALLPEPKLAQFKQGREVDMGLGVKDLSRFRVNAFREQNGIAIACRPIPMRVPSLQELKLPPIVEKLTHCSRGLILVAGPAGSGKTTTLAAFLDAINQREERHILTIEDPMEYVIPNRHSLIHQREVGLHTRSFADGLRNALRENPDVIVTGELRDMESVALAIRAAETGHLVLGTLHSGSAVQAVTRILGVFESALQPSIRVQLSQSLQAIIAQKLLNRRDGKGMVVATEALIATYAVRNVIQQNRIQELRSYLQCGSQEGMHTLEQSVRSLTDQGLVDAGETVTLLP
jgi:twitching motility protein PilT